MKECVYIEGRRNGYSPKQCGYTMTVNEIVEYLENNFDGDTPVYLCNDNGYTYGNITEESIYLDEEQEDN